MSLREMLFKVEFIFKELATKWTLDRSLSFFSFFGDLDQVFIRTKRFLFHLIFRLKVTELSVVLLDLVSNSLGRLDLVLVLHV